MGYVSPLSHTVQKRGLSIPDAGAASSSGVVVCRLSLCSNGSGWSPGLRSGQQSVLWFKVSFHS